MLDENEFLSPHGIRALSKFHQRPSLRAHCERTCRSAVDYEPAESSAGLVRRKFQLARAGVVSAEFSADRVAAADYTTITAMASRWNVPTGSGQQMTLWEVAAEISRRLSHIFLREAMAAAPVYGGDRAISERSVLARSDSILRIFPRRQWRGSGRKPSDGLDGAGGEIDRAEWGVAPQISRSRYAWFCSGALQCAIGVTPRAGGRPALRDHRHENFPARACLEIRHQAQSQRNPVNVIEIRHGENGFAHSGIVPAGFFQRVGVRFLDIIRMAGQIYPRTGKALSRCHPRRRFRNPRSVSAPGFSPRRSAAATPCETSRNTWKN